MAFLRSKTKTADTAATKPESKPVKRKSEKQTVEGEKNLSGEFVVKLFQNNV